MLDRLAVPIVLAPMAGGPSTPALAAAVANAGGLGFVAGALFTPQRLEEELAATRALTDAPLGVNLFVPSGAPADPEVVAAYARRIAPHAERAGIALGEPRHHDDSFAAKVEILRAAAPAVVSFTFGCPGPEVVDPLRAAGSLIWVTVTTPQEAATAAAAGADALVLQGSEAGGHRGAFADTDDNIDYGVLALLQLAREAAGPDMPLIAAGGIATRDAVRGVLAAGAAAAQVGTAFMLCPEAGTPPQHRAAIADPARVTGITRAFSGRRARGIVNEIQREHSVAAPIAYPEIATMMAPLRAHAAATGDDALASLWAGDAHALAQARPAAEVVAALNPNAAGA